MKTHHPVLMLLIALALAAPLHAQVPASPTSKLLWDQAGTDLAEVQRMAHLLAVDELPLVTLANKSCTGNASPFQCESPTPAMTPGAHVLRLKARLDDQESAFSASLAIVMVVLQPPTNLRIGLK